jgi:hypothetical protein
MTSQFPEFFNPIFGRFLLFGPTVSRLFHSPVVVRPPEKRKKNGMGKHCVRIFPVQFRADKFKFSQLFVGCSEL